MFHWQLKDWPHFTYSVEKLREISIYFAQEFGAINGLLAGLKDDIKQETVLEIMIEEAIKTSKIEGELMSREDVMSSLKNNLGIQQSPAVKDKRASDIARLIVEISQASDHILTIDTLCHWHDVLMEHNPKINPGRWRQGTEPMQIISGAYGREIVHYQAPPAVDVPKEMDTFIKWFQSPKLKVKDNISKALLKSSIAHLYFESIHPFEDGNGRIGRALAEFTLRESLGVPVFISLSKNIEKNRRLYYEQLKNAQRSLNITAWINYFSEVILQAQRDTKELVEFTLKKTQFFDRYKNLLNERQLKVLNRILEEGSSGFTGGMTARKYMAITKTSKASATRDLQHLHELGVFVAQGAGRSASYQLVL